MENKHTPAYSIDFVEQKERYIESLTEQVKSLKAENARLDQRLDEVKKSSSYSEINRVSAENSQLREERKELVEIVIDVTHMTILDQQTEPYKWALMQRATKFLDKFPEVPNTTLTKEQMRQQDDLSEQREEYD